MLFDDEYYIDMCFIIEIELLFVICTIIRCSETITGSSIVVGRKCCIIYIMKNYKSMLIILKVLRFYDTRVKRQRAAPCLYSGGARAD